MVWIDSIETQSPLLIDETVLEIIHIKHTLLIAVLTPTSIILLNQDTFLPIAVETRAPESIKQHGYNQQIQSKEFNVNYSELQKLNKVNIFCQTDSDYLIIYQVSIDNTRSIYEVYDNNNSSKNGSSVVLQKKYPTSYSNAKFSIQNIIKNVKSLISEATLNLENIEQFSNYQQEEDKSNSEIEYGKISIFKIIKVGIGINKFWVKANSHNVFVFNNNLFQVINIRVLTNEIFNFDEFDWYDGGSIKYIEYWKDGLFILMDENNQIWGFKVTDLNPIGYKILTSLNIDFIKFNPVYDILLVYGDNEDDSHDIKKTIKLYKYEDHSLKYLQTIDNFVDDYENIQITWSMDGEFLIVLNNKGYWMIVSKFGNVSINTLDISNELNCPFLPASKILINCNCMSLNLIYDNTIYKVNLSRLNNYQDLLFVTLNYIVVLNNDSKLIKFPLLPSFKSILSNLEQKSDHFKISLNSFDQLIISYGDELSVSTPIKTGNLVNHIVWFNFRNYYMETLNIINHIPFRNYIILVNRTTKEINNKDQSIDELIILNIGDMKFGNGGNQIHFDSDLIIWRQNIPNRILSIELISDNLVILENISHKLLVFKLSENVVIGDKLYNFHIKLNKTIHLGLIPQQKNLSIDFNKVSRITMIDLEHIIFLLNNGDFYLLKNQSNKILLTNYYQLVKLNEAIEFFKIDFVKFSTHYIKYIYLFKGNSMLIYNLTNLIELSFDQSIHITDGIEDIELPLLIQPIVINYSNFQPLKILQTSKSISLVGLQDLITNKNWTKVKANNKLILNNLIEFDLVNKVEPNAITSKFGKFDNFNYCLELLLYKYLTNDDPLINNLIKLVNNDLIVYINCLRKVEFSYWLKFFKTLGITPIAMMHQILEDDNNDVELCYSFLIIYLNCKKEEENYGKLNDDDKSIILRIMKYLDHEKKWDWCFELCRFVKLLDPSSEFLKKIKGEITS